ncbi:Interferon-related developmental regulator 1 [Oryzias melastigma]|uniref:Interferon-related developmental regulator 1 n=1 Tax=Oryzias melastigma TaxID=30732 RepID=A0A834F683_ORYME|nr:Interferon-related developmental regulator 1 [Oryzias melastigma]
MSSYPNREGALPTPKPGSSGLHTAAIQAWSLLVTLCPASKLSVLLDFHLPKLKACLESSDVNYRIAVGETIALLVELGRDIDEEFEVEDSETLCESLKSFSYRWKQAQSQERQEETRSIFREVLHYIENEDFTEGRSGLE